MPDNTRGGTRLIRTAFLICLGWTCCTAMAAQGGALADRVGNTGFVQLTAESFQKLTPREQALAYWLSQASIAIDPIIYDQLSRFGLRQKRLLETMVETMPTHPQGVKPAVMRKIIDFTKLFWANKGNHNELTSQKFLPEFTFEEFKAAAGPKLAAEVDALKASLFDPDFEPMITAKSPRGKLDILQASSNNFYLLGLSMVDIQGFHERYPLNSRLAKQPDGKLAEQVYRAGTPDGKTPPGLYAEYLRRADDALEKARAYADPAQARAIAVADSLLSNRRSARLGAIRHRLGAGQSGGGFRQRFHRSVSRRARGQGQLAEFCHRHRRCPGQPHAQAVRQRAVLRRPRALARAVQDAGRQTAGGQGRGSADRNGRLPRHHRSATTCRTRTKCTRSMDRRASCSPAAAMLWTTPQDSGRWKSSPPRRRR